MLVYKFGGGVLKNPDGIRKMADIIKEVALESKYDRLVIVVSALGKTTNALEKLWSDWVDGIDTGISYNRLVEFHQKLAAELLGRDYENELKLEEIYESIRALISGPNNTSKNQAYDQLIVFGELLSSRIVSAYLNESGINHSTVDAREFIKTDSLFRDARLDFINTERGVYKTFKTDEPTGQINSTQKLRIWLTQGFIGSDGAGNSTSLGREGSDFTAAVIASVLDAEKIVVWKDVPGVMTGDPVRFADVQKMDQISYLEAIELSYFGAKILHPNTIKPLQNKGIPLYVNSIFNPELIGTKVVGEPQIKHEKPVIIIKANQVLISLQPRDFSFIMEDAVSKVFASLSRYNMRVNLLQHGAVSLSFCLDYDESGLNKLIGDLIADYKILYNKELKLLTIRHYTQEAIERYTRGRKIYVQQQSRRTARFVLS